MTRKVHQNPRKRKAEQGTNVTGSAESITSDSAITATHSVRQTESTITTRSSRSSKRHVITRSASQAQAHTIQQGLVPELIPKLLTKNPRAALHFHQESKPTESISYNEIYAITLKVAAELQQGGITPLTHTTIGIKLARGPDLVIAFLAVWLAGGIVVPLEVGTENQPLAEYKATLAEVKVIIDDAYMTKIKDDKSLTLFNFKISSSCTSTTPAYIIFTSGSTGKPKGVLVSHGALANLYRSMEKQRLQRVLLNLYTAHVLDNDGIIINAPATFDAFFAELLLGINCPNMHFLEEKLRRSPTAIMHLIIDFKITIGIFSADLAEKIDPQILAMLTDFTSMGSDPGKFLHQLIYINKLMLVRNEIGWTEACVRGTEHYIHWRIWDETDAYSVGEPIDGCEIYLVHSNTLKISNEGEIFVAGICLADKYIKNKAATDKKFITLACDTKNNYLYELSDAKAFGLEQKRFYRTGDKGRRLANGSIVFEGRIDKELKISGYRINPEAVERYLAELEAINNVAIVGFPEHKPKFLVSYIELKSGSTLTNEATYQHLESKELLRVGYPRHVFFGEIPLTSNGKIDYTEVYKVISAKLALKSVVSNPPITEPRNAEEKSILSLWRKATGYKGPLDITSSSLDMLGGDSTDLLSLQHEINLYFDLKFPHSISTPEFCAATTIEDQAKLVATKREIAQSISSSSSISTRPLGHTLFARAPTPPPRSVLAVGYFSSSLLNPSPRGEETKPRFFDVSL